MADKAPEPDKKPGGQMVPLSDLVAYKKGAVKKERELEGQVAKLQKNLSDLQAEVDVTMVDVSDEEVYKARKKELLDVKRKLDTDRTEMETKRTALDEELRAVRVKSLVAEYSAKGLQLDTEELMTEKAPEVVARDRFIDFLEANPKGKEEETPANQVFENVNIGVTKKMPHDMVLPNGRPDPAALAEFKSQHSQT